MNQIVKRSVPVAVVLAAAGLACPALGQDSVSNTPGVWNNVVGDAVRQHNTAEQGNAYVVDLTSLITSWNHTWGIGVIAKTSRVGAAPDAFFNTLASNVALSPDFKTGVNRSTTQYRLWEFATVPGHAPGVNATANTNQYVDVPGPASTMQLGWGLADFGGVENNNVVGGTVAWSTTTNPGRLFVNRVIASVSNSADDLAAQSDQSLGSVDADANLYIRADREQVTGGGTPITGDNLYRIDAEARNLTKINWVNSQLLAGTSTGTNDTAATNTIAAGYVTGGGHFLPPSNVPESLGKRLVTTTAFDTTGDFYVFENPANSSTLQLEDHLDGARTSGIRGATRVVPFNWLGGVATGAQLTKPQNAATFGAKTVANGGNDTWGFSIWGIDATGDTVAGSQRTFALPWSFTAPDPAILDNAPGVSGLDPRTGAKYQVPDDSEFDNYRGTAVFRGPVSQPALGEDLTGNHYIAAVVYTSATYNGQKYNPGNALVVGKVNTGAAPGTVTWSVAAWNNFDERVVPVDGASGKAILDGPNGNVIGRLVPFEVANVRNLRGGFAAGTIGPSMSCAGFDNAGNLYFVSTIQLQRGNTLDVFDPQNGGGPPLPLIDNGSGQITAPNPERDLYEIGLIRAVLDPNTFTYQLELVARTGAVYSGGNTQLNYMLETMYVGANNNGGPVPAQFDSGNITTAARNNGAPANNASADSLGGLIIEARIIYDIDGADTRTPANSADGAGYAADYPTSLGGSGPFEDMSLGLGTAYFPLSKDEAYQVVLFIGNTPSVIPVAACCLAGNTCTDTTQVNCTKELNGVWQGVGVLCASSPCAPVIPTGACCAACVNPVGPSCPPGVGDPSGPPGVCTILSSADCLALNGQYKGDSTVCNFEQCDCTGDINNDGVTNVNDFNILAGQYGKPTIASPGCRTRAQGDLNCDGIVNVNDFNILAGSYGCS